MCARSYKIEKDASPIREWRGSGEVMRVEREAGGLECGGRAKITDDEKQKRYLCHGWSLLSLAPWSGDINLCRRRGTAATVGWIMASQPLAVPNPNCEGAGRASCPWLLCLWFFVLRVI